MTYEDALKYLYSFLNYEIQTDYSYPRDLNLARMAFLMKLFGNPHRKIPFVLVGGTKGKGSTAFLLSSIVKEAGYRVGLYTSPHLREPLERIVVSGEKISKEDFASLFRRIKIKLTEKPLPLSLGRITFFELFTTAMILYFAEENVDLGILEVGLGGRLDATNIVNPLLSILTPISYDHQDKLGNTLGKIAREKVPIVKEGTFFVSARQRPKVQSLFLAWASQKRAKGFFLGKNFDFQIQNLTEAGSIFTLRLNHEILSNLFISLPGGFQIENAACAVQASRILSDFFSFRIDEKSIRYGLENSSQWHGRFQIMIGEPLVILDGAHNGASFRALRESTEALFPQKEVTMILALSKDKDVTRITKEIKRFRLKRIIATQAHTPRAFPFKGLVKKLMRKLPSVVGMPNLKESIQFAFQEQSGKDLILVTGSLFLVAEAETLFEHSPELVTIN